LFCGSVGRTELFALEIKVQGFVTTDPNGRKTYTKEKVMRWEMEIGSFTLNLLMSSLLEEVKWGSNQSAIVWFYDKRIGEGVRLDNEIQMIDMFEMYKSEMSCAIVAGIFDKVVVDSQIERELDDLTPLCVIPPLYDAPLDVPTSSHVHPSFDVHTSSQLDPPLDVPTAQPHPADASDPDPFDNEEEYVGFDDEHIYMPTAPAPPPTQDGPVQPSHPTQPADNDNPTPPPANPEAEVNDADLEELHVIHDPGHPNIIKGALFPDIISFRKAVRHYAIVRGFAFADLKTDPTRFIAKCASEGCPWRIHASRVQGQSAIQVILLVDFICCPLPLFCCCARAMKYVFDVQIKVLPAEHNCPTTKLVEGKMATQGWVADRLSD